MTFRELNLSDEEIHEVMLVDEGCSETELWPSLEAVQFALTRFYIGHTVEWMLNQPSLFASDQAT